jgi:hypothetical protein
MVVVVMRHGAVSRSFDASFRAARVQSVIRDAKKKRNVRLSATEKPPPVHLCRRKKSGASAAGGDLRRAICDRRSNETSARVACRRDRHRSEAWTALAMMTRARPSKLRSRGPDRVGHRDASDADRGI